MQNLLHTVSVTAINWFLTDLVIEGKVLSEINSNDGTKEVLKM